MHSGLQTPGQAGFWGKKHLVDPWFLSVTFLDNVSCSDDLSQSLQQAEASALLLLVPPRSTVLGVKGRSGGHCAEGKQGCQAPACSAATEGVGAQVARLVWAVCLA